MGSGVQIQSCWPTPVQLLLLDATLLQGDECRNAWRQWRSEADPDNLDQGSNRLLPETYTNLVANGVEDPLLGRMKGLKRKAWLENQLLFHHATKLLKLLRQHDIPTLVTKGAALVVRHYEDPGRRPMADFDIVVPEPEGSRALQLLIDNGLRLAEGWNGNFEHKHAVALMDETGRQFDLHWRVLYYLEETNLFWDKAVTIRVNETSTLALCPTDLLFHVLIHGARANEVPPIRWIVDAAVIVRTTNERLDWHRLAEIAGRYAYGHRLLETFDFLERYKIELPEQTRQRLSSSSSGLQYVEFELVTGERKRSVITQIALVWLGFQRYVGPESILSKLNLFPAYLERKWDVESVWKLPWEALSRTVRRFRLSRRAARSV